MSIVQIISSHSLQGSESARLSAPEKTAASLSVALTLDLQDFDLICKSELTYGPLKYL